MKGFALNLAGVISSNGGSTVNVSGTKIVSHPPETMVSAGIIVVSGGVVSAGTESNPQ